MNRCYRFMFALAIAFALNFYLLPAPAHSLSTSSNQVTAKEIFQMGVKTMQQGNYSQAITYFTQVIQQQRNFAGAYSNRCLAHLQLQDYQNAVTDCTAAIDFFPGNPEAYLNRGIAHYRLLEYAEAIADDNQVIALQPRDFRAYYNRGIASAALGNYQQAISDYNLALTQIPQKSNYLLGDIYNDRGLAYFELKDLSAAMLNFDMAIRLNSNNYRAYYNRGCACARNGNYFGAASNFTEVIRLNPSDGNALMNRGIAYHRLGYEQAAIADLQQAAEYFGVQGKRIAYERTLDLIKIVQREIPSHVEIALAF
ncbi:MAG: tetratricopeptide repeat protein [Nostocaceae cyanobacterium]|nr:tetratricopeptide repeat protein [Nostocaceae cyanobacterium]